MPRCSRTELYLFLATFFAFAFFNQGGGWNQNSRFAEVRAMAEQGRFAIDDFLVYRVPPGSEDLTRVPVSDTIYELDGQRFRLCWVDMEYNLVPVREAVADELAAEPVPMVEVCASGDVAYVPKTGHFHPNKPPGTSLLALPAYWVIWQVERWAGINPDHWWTLTVNAWLTSALSVGLGSALGCVLFFRLARDLAGGSELPAVLATVALAFGTTFFPFGTVMFDHNLTAALLVAAFYFLRCHRSLRADALAGFCAGLAAITNYVAAVAVIFLGLYLLLARSRWQWRPSLAYTLGVVPPFLLICYYGYVNFGSPFRINNDFQNPLFADPRGALGMFALPNPYVGALLLISPYRGIFFLAPVLILGTWGLITWLREKTFVSEARLCLAIFAFFFVVNMSFNGYHGGFSAGPRYLVPGLPFLALGLVTAFLRVPIWTLGLLAISVVHHVLLTVTDAQNPLAVGGHARLDDAHRSDDFFSSIVWDYAWPLYATGKVGPLIEQLLEAKIDHEADVLAASDMDETAQEKDLALRRAEWEASIANHEQTPFLLASIRGPVSVNPLGIY